MVKERLKTDFLIGPARGVRMVKLGFFFIAISLLACAGAPNRFVYQSGKDWVKVRPVARTDAKAQPFSHPYAIDEDKIEKLLSQVYYSHSMFVSLAWSKPLSVFTKNQRVVLSRAFHKAFLEMTPGEELEFSIRSEKKISHETKGRAFLANGSLHLIFDSIDRPSYWGKEGSYQRREAKWKLVPREGQSLFATRLEGKGQQRNWLVMPLLVAGGNI